VLAYVGRDRNLLDRDFVAAIERHGHDVDAHARVGNGTSFFQRVADVLVAV
jgi:hypothetical protein